MCGIYGYVGHRNGIKIALEGLKCIEYRGYDSAGIGAIINNTIFDRKEVGKISKLQLDIGEHTSHTVIAHTRWATHGKVNLENAHPHFDQNRSFAVVLNGIIENYQQLKDMLITDGITFTSETDAEVLPHLIAKVYEGDFARAVQQALLLIRGSYAISVLSKHHPNQLIVAANGCPLVIGIGTNETFVCSDPNALVEHTRDVIFLSDGEIAQLSKEEVEIFDASMVQISKAVEKLLHSVDDVDKGNFEHYTLKEIYDQPQTVRNALFSRYNEEYGTLTFDNFKITTKELQAIKNVIIVACGTSWHAGYIASYLLEELSHIPSQVRISSEFRYSNPVLPEGSFAIAISQSGETADTLAAVRELKAKGIKVVGICNVQGSQLSREADACIYLRAGPEIGVCSTKAFTSQLVTLILFTLQLARMRQMSKMEAQTFLHALEALPEQIEKILHKAKDIEKIAKKYSQYNDFFFIGRRYMYPTCLEAALKLKEIAYVNSNGYAAGEMKHGPIALINETCPTIAFCADHIIEEKIISNLMEIKARKGRILAIAYESSKGIDTVVDDYISIPNTRDELAPILTSVVGQLFAYYVAKERGAEIDRPRNLAKSVTVE